MTKLEAFCDAIKQYEGWYPFSRSWRNNNPGNLRWSKFQTGNKDNFATFPNFATGWLALWWDVFCKCTGRTKTRLGPESNLFDFCNVWAPSADNNDPKNYAEFIAEKLNIKTTTQLKYFVDDL